MRDDTVKDWLARTDWASWERTPIKGDASARRYERLHGPNEQTVILMNAPPKICGSQDRFVTIARHLNAHGLTAPHILDWDDGLGFMILSDLGGTDVAAHLRAMPADEHMIYGAAVDVLRQLRNLPVLDNLPHMTPDVGAAMLGPAFDWAAKETSPQLRQEIEGQLKTLLSAVDPDPSTMSLRDFHAENLIWRPDQSGVARIGLLDFQDAFVTHSTYDLASLIRDARRDVSANMLGPLLAKLDPDKNPDQHHAAFHIMAVQRNLRILGIFHKLAEQDGKRQYLDLIPRVKAHLRKDLDHPALVDLKPLATRAFLDETR